MIETNKQVITVSYIPSLEPLINEIYVDKTIPLNELKNI